jgi:spermidine synthase
MLCEVGWTRILALTIGSSVYGFTLMLAAFLVGLAGGAAFFARLIDRWRLDAARTLGLLLMGAACASWATAMFLGELPYLFARIYTWTAGSLSGMFAGQMAICLLAMFPATFLMGGVFPLVLRLQARDRAGIGRPVGESYAANTLGTVFGAALAGFVLVPTIGVRSTLYLAIGIYLALAALLAFPRRPVARGFLTAGSAGLAVVLFSVSPAWDPRELMSGIYTAAKNLEPGFTRERFMDDVVRGDTILYYKEGINANVMVAVDSGDTVTHQLYLSVNGKTDATSASDLDTQILLGQLPFLFRPDARKALVIGLGSGITVSSVATRDVTKIRVLEVEPAIIGAARCFDKFNRSILSDPHVEVVVNDARNDLLLRDESYDVIVSEPSNPWMTVAANLFTQDFFRSAKARLPGGVFLPVGPRRIGCLPGTSAPSSRPTDRSSRTSSSSRPARALDLVLVDRTARA